MDDIEKLKWELNRKREIRLDLQKEIQHLDELRKLPFHEMIQQPGQEDKLKEVEEVQEETFHKIIRKRKHKEIIEDEKDLFCLFFSEFLKGNCKSINDFLYGSKKQNQINHILKSEFKNAK